MGSKDRVVHALILNHWILLKILCYLTHQQKLRIKILIGEFIVSLFFIEKVMGKTKVLTYALQKEELYIINAITLIDSTASNLRE